MIKIKDYYPIAYTPEDEVYKLLKELEERNPPIGKGFLDLSDIVVEDADICLRGFSGHYVPEEYDKNTSVGYSLGVGEALFKPEKKPVGREDSITCSELLRPVIKKYGEPTRFGENGCLIYRFVLGKRTVIDRYLDKKINKKTNYLSKVLYIGII